MRPLKPLILTLLLLCVFDPSTSSATTVVGDYGVSTTGYISSTQLITTNVSFTAGGTTWGYISSTGSYLPNLATNRISATSISTSAITLPSPPTASTDAANKAYVDTAVAAAGNTTHMCAATTNKFAINVSESTLNAYCAAEFGSGFTFSGMPQLSAMNLDINTALLIWGIGNTVAAGMKIYSTDPTNNCSAGSTNSVVLLRNGTSGDAIRGTTTCTTAGQLLCCNF